MTDKKYRRLSRLAVSDQVYYVLALTRRHPGYTYITKHRIWLTLIGLLETADLIK